MRFCTTIASRPEMRKMKTRMDAAVPMDAQNAPTGTWNTAQNAVSHSAHTQHRSGGRRKKNESYNVNPASHTKFLTGPIEAGIAKKPHELTARRHFLPSFPLFTFYFLLSTCHYSQPSPRAHPRVSSVPQTFLAEPSARGTRRTWPGRLRPPPSRRPRRSPAPASPRPTA